MHINIFEHIVFILFVGLFSLTYVGFFFSVAKLLKRGKGGRKIAKADIGFLAVGTLGIFCMLYGLVEPFFLEVTNARIVSPKVTHPFRLVHITDLHCDGVKRCEDVLVQKALEAQPDFVVFTGDAVNNQAGIPLFKKVMNQLSVSVPVFVVKGNHDFHGTQLWDRFGGTGVTMVSGHPQNIVIKGQRICIAGVDVGSEAQMNTIFDSISPDDYSIFLYHYPDAIGPASAHKMDLYLAGHTHGGQIRLPFYGAIITNSASGKKYEAGAYEVGKTDMYVGRGVGMMGIPVRFLAKPELTVIDVAPASK